MRSLTISFTQYIIIIFMMIDLIEMEAPPSCWTVICAPEEQEAKVLMAIDQSINELDSFQHKPKVISYCNFSLCLNLVQFHP